MKVLYVNRGATLGDTGKAMTKRGHDLVSRNRCAEALTAIRAGTFDAVLIEDGNEDLQMLVFIVEAHHADPGLPIFVSKDWGRDLPEAIEEFAENSTTEHDMPCCL
jgi:DNA-binding NtrC family response regulator